MTGVRIVADAQLEALIRIARDASRRAADLYDQHRRSGIEVAEKAPGDPVTRADREIDAFVVDALQKEFPDAGIVSEESAPEGAALDEVMARDEVFFVDPIDGTREFVAKTGEFATMIGLARGGRASAGVVAFPADGRLFAGRIGQRAFSESASGSRSLLMPSRIGRFDEATLVVSRSHEPPIVAPLRRRLGIHRVAQCGSVGLKVARVAEGAADVYVHGGHGLALWDACGPEAILLAGGGRMSDLDGAPLDYRGPMALQRGIVATNGLLHAGVMSAISWAEREARRLVSS